MPFLGRLLDEKTKLYPKCNIGLSNDSVICKFSLVSTQWILDDNFICFVATKKFRAHHKQFFEAILVKYIK